MCTCAPCGGVVEMGARAAVLSGVFLRALPRCVVFRPAGRLLLFGLACAGGGCPLRASLRALSSCFGCLFARSVPFARVFCLIFRFFLLPDFCLSKFFSFVAHAATGTPIFFSERKWGKRTARGAAHRAAPLRTPLTAPCGQSFPLSALLAGLTALRAANRRLTGKRLKSPGAELSFSSVSVRRGTPCALSPLSPFFLAAGRLKRPFRPQTAGWQGKRPKSQRSRAQLFGRFCALGMRRGFRLAGFPTGRREQESGFLPAWENRSPARAHARKESRACEE